MNYKERMNKLRSFKAAVSSGETQDDVSGVSSSIGGWTGGESKEKFENYITILKTDAAKLAGYKSKYLTAIDDRISKIQGLFDSEYNANSWIKRAYYDKDSAKNKQARLRTLNNSSMDSSVKEKLRSEIR